MKSLAIITAIILILPFVARASTDCIYTATKSNIEVRFRSTCIGRQSQAFIDSFVNQLALKINRVDTFPRVLVLVNIEFLYYDFSGTPDYFTSVGLDTLREMDIDFINRYCNARYGSSDQSKPHPLDINATDDKSRPKEIGVKIIYNVDYRKKVSWTEVERLISFAIQNFNQIKEKQQRDTVRHYSWYVSLLSLDTTAINQIIGRSNKEIKKYVTKKAAKNLPYKLLFIAILVLLVIIVVYRIVKPKTSN